MSDNTPKPADPASAASERALPAIADWTGYLGLLPFAAAMLGVAFAPSVVLQDYALRLAIAYGAAILSFVGAVHFGFCVLGRLPWTLGVVIGATTPAVVGAAAVLIGGQRGLALLIVGFGLFWLYEARSPAVSLPPSYLSLRRVLSVSVCALLALTLLLADHAGLR